MSGLNYTVSLLIAHGLIELSSLPEGSFVRVECFLAGWFGLFFSSLKYPLLAAADALMGVESLKNELRGRYLLFGTFLLRNAERTQFVDEALDLFQILQGFDGRN